LAAEVEQVEHHLATERMGDRGEAVEIMVELQAEAIPMQVQVALNLTHIMLQVAEVEQQLQVLLEVLQEVLQQVELVDKVTL
jgi:hypothetical protein